VLARGHELCCHGRVVQLGAIHLVVNRLIGWLSSSSIVMVPWSTVAPALINSEPPLDARRNPDRGPCFNVDAAHIMRLT
jgi:hypothetical protein